jgi:hypothetical protein
MKGDEAGFLTTIAILELLIIPYFPLGKYGGGIAMFAVGIIALIAYFVLFGERLRSRGQLKTLAIIATVSIVVGAAVAFGLAMLLRAH